MDLKVRRFRLERGLIVRLHEDGVAMQTPTPAPTPAQVPAASSQHTDPTRQEGGGGGMPC